MPLNLMEGQVSGEYWHKKYLEMQAQTKILARRAAITAALKSVTVKEKPARERVSHSGGCGGGGQCGGG
jgi:hypothetical protein